VCQPREGCNGRARRLPCQDAGNTPDTLRITLSRNLAIADGLSVCTYIALRHIPSLPPEQRRKAKAAFVAAYAALALVLATAAASVLAAPAGERAHVEHFVSEMKSATESRQRAAAKAAMWAVLLLRSPT
jgi:hypothetical protein